MEVYGDYKRIVILFGSQTGKACALAQEIFDNCTTKFGQQAAPSQQLSIHCYSFDLIGSKYLIEHESLVIMITATVGEGEPPYNTIPFWRHLSRRTLPRGTYLNKLKYALFALGDSNYERFATFGKQLDQRLLELGANQFYKTGFGDDSVGLELGFAPWLEGLMDALQYELSCDVSEQRVIYLKNPVGDEFKKLEGMDKSEHKLTLPTVFGSSVVVSFDDPDVNVNHDDLVFPKYPLMDSHIFKVKLIDMKLLTGKSSLTNPEEKIIFEATFRGGSDAVKWIPGDAFGFITGNSDFEVSLIIKSLKLGDKSNHVVNIFSTTHTHLPKKCTLFNLIKYYLDIRAVPKKSVLKAFGDHCTDDKQRECLHKLASREGSEDYKTRITQTKTSILDVLVMYDSCSPPLDLFLSILPGLSPRFYSLLDPKRILNKFRIAFNVISHKQINGRQDTQLFGVFTGYMYKIWEKGTKMGTQEFNAKDAASLMPKFFKSFRKRNDHFTIPPKIEIPMIMIAIGTGVTPFLSFLEHRRHMHEINKESRHYIEMGENWLFYGCRHPDQDFIYSKEITKFEDDFILRSFAPCFSRDPNAQMRHVQDAILAEHKALYDLINDENAYIYVCGDQGKFSVEVFNTFIEVVSRNIARGQSAKLFMNQIRDKGRYLQDIWS